MYRSICFNHTPGLGNDVMSQLYSADCIITESDTHHALLRTYNGEAKIITAPTPEKSRTTVPEFHMGTHS